MNATDYRKKLGYGFEESFEAAEREVLLRELQERMEKHQAERRRSEAQAKRPVCRKKFVLLEKVIKAFGL